MGWTVGYRTPGLTTQEYFEREFPNTLGGKILACATAPQEFDSGSTFYAAVQEPDGEVWAFVALTKNYGRGEYGYKEMEESCGPSESRCPAKILDLLTPTESEWANQWRERCRANAAKAGPVKVKVGDRLRFAEPLKFTDGTEETELVVESLRPPNFRRAAPGLGRVRLGRSWKREYEYEVVAA